MGWIRNSEHTSLGERTVGEVVDQVRTAIAKAGRHRWGASSDATASQIVLKAIAEVESREEITAFPSDQKLESRLVRLARELAGLSWMRNNEHVQLGKRTIAQVIDQVRRSVRNIATHRCTDPDEVAQKAISSAVQEIEERHTLQDFPDDEELARRLWCYSRQRAGKATREMWRAQKIVSNMTDSGPAPDPENEAPADRADAMATADAANCLKPLFDNLTQDDRDILHMHGVEGKTFRQIGAKVGRNLKTVADRYYRACDRLREQLWRNA